MSWYVLITIHLFLMASVPLIHRWALRNSKFDATAFAVYFQFSAGMFALLMALVGNPEFDVDAYPKLNLAISVAMNAMMYLLGARALRRIDAGTYGLMMNTRALWTILFAVIVLSETFTGLQTLGAFLIVSGSVTAVYRKGMKIRLGEGEVLTLIAAVTIAVAYVADLHAVKDGLDGASWLAAVLLGSTVALAAVYPKSIPKGWHLLKTNRYFRIGSLVSSLFFAGGVVAIISAFQTGANGSLLAGISQFQMMIVVLGSILVLNERDRVKQKLGASIIAILGLIIINL